MTTSLSASVEAGGSLASGPSALEVATLQHPNLFVVPFVYEARHNDVFYFPMRKGRIGTLSSMFESVKFEAFEFAVMISGHNAVLRFAAIGGIEPVTERDWLSAPVGQYFVGNSQGYTSTTYQFPSSHPFGREMKAVTLGNPRPSFMFKFTGDPSDKCWVRGKITIQCGGFGLPAPISLSTFNPPTPPPRPPTANSSVARVASSITPVEEETDEEQDDE